MQLKKKQLRVEIDDSIMEPTSLKLNGVEFLYQKTASWKKDFPTLFPIVGMLINDEYSVNDKFYSLKRHGFFREIKGWKLQQKTASMASFIFQSSGQFLNVYPWDFELGYRFELLDNMLKIITSVTNLSTSTMYYSLGYHPAFLVEPTGVINFDKPQNLFRDSVDLKYLVEKPVDGVLIDQKFIKDLDFTNSQFYSTTNNQASLFTYSDDQKEFSIDLTTYLNKTFTIWSEDNDSGYVCFEPMDGHADFGDKTSTEIKLKDQIIGLEPYHSHEHFFTLKVKLKK